jgi:hypothetical protein
MVFGFQLKQHQPFEWNNEFASKELYFRSLKEHAIRPVAKVSWNFENSGTDPRAVFAAFSGKLAEKEFDALVETEVNPESRLKLKAAHSAVVAQACHEVLEHREFLVRLLHEIPEGAKWIVVWNECGQTARFGTNASVETRTELLSRI